MDELYDNDLISKILSVFNVKNAIISGINDNLLMKNILKYDEAVFTHINTNDSNCISDNPLYALQQLGNYDAIFIDDDSNWYTVINELNIIKKTNEEFPLIFICNNNFPNKRRDSYSNPDIIPVNFRQKYTEELPIYHDDEKIIISDGFFHACEDNTHRNGVLTAIEDFLNENSHVGMIEISFIREICILYNKSQLNQKRISIINQYIQDKKIDNNPLTETLIENQLLISYIYKYKLYNNDLIELETEISKNDRIIKNYENEIRNQNNEINLKDSKIRVFESNLSLKDSQIKNIESKLVNKNRIINDLENQLKIANEDLDSLVHDFDNRGVKINDLEDQLKTANSDLTFLTKKINESADEFNQINFDYNNKVNSLEEKIHQNDINFQISKNEWVEQLNVKDNKINVLEHDVSEKEDNIILLQDKLNNQISITRKNISKLDNEEYCISCYKKEISNKILEIEYLKKDNIIKKILNFISYLYLIIISSPKEVLLNIKLYKTLKNSECFDIGFYLSNNDDLINSKWCKYFSPELHYICKGFDENRTFNKKYFNRASKKDLLECLLNCDE